MSTIKCADKESEYEPINPPPLYVEKPVVTSERLEKSDQVFPKQGEPNAELSPEKIPGPSESGQGKRQTGFDILKSKAVNAADHVKQQIRSVLPVRQKLSQDQWAKMGQRNRSKLKHLQGEGAAVEEQEPSFYTDSCDPGKQAKGQCEPASKIDEKVTEVPVLAEEMTGKANANENDQREIVSVDECQLDTISGATKRKYIRHRRQLPQMLNPIASLRTQVEDFKSRLKRSLTPPKIQVHRGKRRRSRSADTSRATSQEPEGSICCSSERGEEEEERDNLDKMEKTTHVTVTTGESAKPSQIVVKAPTDNRPPPVALVELTKEASSPPPRPPRPASTLSTPTQREEGKEGGSMYQTFPLERPKQKHPQGYVSKFLKEHPLEESYASIETTPEVKQVSQHDYEIISEGPAKPIRRRRKQPNLPSTTPLFHYNTIAANEWRKEFENNEMTQPALPIRPRRERQKSGSVSGSEAGVTFLKADEKRRVISVSIEPNIAKEQVGSINVKAFRTNTEVPTTFPRKKKKGPKCLQETMGQKDPGRPPPSMFINIMQGRPLPPPPKPERSRGSLNSLEQSSIEMSVGFRHYAYQTIGLESGLSPISSGAMVDTKFSYPNTSAPKPENEAILHGQTMESLPKPSNNEPSSSHPSEPLPEEPVDDKLNSSPVLDVIIHSEPQQPCYLPQIPMDASQNEGMMNSMMMIPSASTALGRILLRLTSRSLQTMANYVETALSDDTVIAEAQRANKKVLLCILLVLVVGLILATNQEDNAYVVPSWELWMPPPDIW